MKPYEWSSQESVNYEAALEAINELIGAYSARIAREEAKVTPDLAAVASWEAETDACVQAQRNLDPTQHDDVARIRRDYPIQVRAVRAS